MRTSCGLAALTLCALTALVAPVGCEGSTLATPSTTNPPVDPPIDEDTDSGVIDAAPVDDGAPPSFDDGKPTRIACTSALGHGLTPTHGRLDGTLVSIVAANERNCPADPQHLHLQVQMGGAVYDIAINLDGFEGETDAPMPGGPFSEGWHPALDLDYVTHFGLHTASLAVTSPASIRQRVELALTNANHVSIFATAYTGSDGAHLVHRQAGGRDGAIIINPLAAKPHVIAFRFVDDIF